MAQEGHAALSALIMGCAEVGKHLLGMGAVALCIGRLHIAGKLYQCRGHDGCRRGILRCSRAARVIHIPQGDVVVAGGGQALQVAVGDLAGMGQEALVTGEAVHHRVAIDGPRLSAAPHRLVAVALMGHTLDEVARERIVYRHVVARAVGAEVVLHGSRGMCHGQVAQVAAFPVLGCPEEQFEVDHIVHDGVVPAIVAHVAWPAQHGAHHGVAQRSQRVGSAQRHLAGGGITREFVTLEEGVDDDGNGYIFVEKENGEKDERGQLFYRIIDILKEHPECKYVVLENVRNLADKKENWEIICNELKEQDFIITEEPIIESPHNFGVPQVRERVFILGIRKNAFDRRRVLPEGYLTREILGIDEEINKCPEKGNCLSGIVDNDVDQKYYVTEEVEKLMDAWEEFRANVKGLCSPFWLHKAGVGIYDRELYYRDEDIGYQEMPDWKKALVMRSRVMYENNYKFIDAWIKKHKMQKKIFFIFLKLFHYPLRQLRCHLSLRARLFVCYTLLCDF